MAAPIKPLALGPFPSGMDNRRPEFSMKGDARKGEGDFVRSAVNADVSTQGTISRRQGYTQILAGNDCHSFWSNGVEAYMVDGTTLLRVRNLESMPSTSAVRSDLVPGRPMSYVHTPLGIFYSNGQVLGRLSPDYATAAPAGLRVVPAVAAIAGSLPAGRYGFCFTCRDGQGQESEATPMAWLELAANSGVLLTGLPNDGSLITVYMTEPNGAIPMRACTAPGLTEMILTLPVLGARCLTLLMGRMPAGDIVRHHYGRLLVASGNVLYYSEAYMLGLLRPSKGFIQFPDPISIVQPTSGGVWVCADQTYWLGGMDIAAAQLDAKLPYGGVPGSGAEVPNSNDVFWMSPRGIVLGTQEGEAKNLQEEHVAVPPADFAASLFRETNGLRQMAASTFGADLNRMAANSFMDAEVIRKQVTL